MKPIFCFIDDSAFELEVFSRHLAPAAPGIEFITGFTWDEVREKIETRYPCLFLLDLYGRDPEIKDPIIPDMNELAEHMSGIPSLQDVYAGLDDFQGDRVNEFLKRLFGLADGWRRLFFSASRKSGQNIQYGINNLVRAREEYPAAAAIAYTRKSLIMDAVEVMKAGVDGLDLKPTGPTDEAIRSATEENAKRLIDGWSELVTRRFSMFSTDLALKLYKEGLSEDAIRLDRPEEMAALTWMQLPEGEKDFLLAAKAWSDYRGRSE